MEFLLIVFGSFVVACLSIWFRRFAKTLQEPNVLAQQEEEITSMLISSIMEFQPDTVLTFDPDSGYTGHPVHMAIGITGGSQHVLKVTSHRLLFKKEGEHEKTIHCIGSGLVDV